MKKHSRRLVLCFILTLVALGTSFAAVITCSDGKLINAETLIYKDASLEAKVGSKTITIPRSQIKDISFAAQKQENAANFSTDSSDL